MGSIYKVLCHSTGLGYIGQAQYTKTKNGKCYAYGVKGRWDDHCSCVSETPLGIAIQTYGRDKFVVTTLEVDVPLGRLDEREAYWIASEGTIVPLGYNKMQHGRCRHRPSSSLSLFYAPITVGVELRQIKRNGEPMLIYAYLTLTSGKQVRLTFGQGKGCVYADAVRSACEFLEPFSSVSIDVDPQVLDLTVSPSDERVSRFDSAKIERIRIAKFNHLVAVYVDKERTCFGGKHGTFEESVAKARAFANTLLQKHREARLVDIMSKSATGGCLSS